MSTAEITPASQSGNLVRFRAMTPFDVTSVGAVERSSYPFPWSESIFRDCLRAGHQCWVLEAGTQLLGYGVLSAAAGEAHLLAEIVPCPA